MFTPDPAEYTSNLDLTLITNKALPMAMHPKVLGLTLDPKLTYSTHIHNISVQAHKPLQIIKHIKHTHMSHTRAPTTPRVTIQTENTTYFNTPRLKTLSLTTTATQQTFPQTPTQSLQQT